MTKCPVEKRDPVQQFEADLPDPGADEERSVCALKAFQLALESLGCGCGWDLIEFFFEESGNYARPLTGIARSSLRESRPGRRMASNPASSARLRICARRLLKLWAPLENLTAKFLTKSVKFSPPREAGQEDTATSEEAPHARRSEAQPR